MSKLIKQAKQYYLNGNIKKVMEVCKTILSKKVDFNAIRLMALALVKQNLLRDALAMFEYAVKLAPNNLEIQVEKIGVMIKLAETLDYKMFIRVAAQLRSLIKEHPNNFTLVNKLIKVYLKLFFENNAFRLVRDFIARNPNCAEAYYAYYGLLIMRGEFEEAKKILDEASSINPVFALDITWDKINEGYDTSKRIDDLIKINQTLKISDHFKSFYYLNRALTHQRRKEYDEAFRYFLKANKKYRTLQNYNFSKYVHDFNKLVQGFTKEKYLKLKEQSKKFTQADVVPVFICGLPRSGSTLIESVLTAHEEVAGVGEINDFKENFIHVLGDLSVHPSGYVLDWNLIDEEKLLVLRERYLKLLKAKNARVNKDGKGKFLINKMLTNFQYFPLIKLMFPEAIIIHAQRHPIDMLWSCFKIFFDGDDKYIYNLDELAAHYNIYRELTDHWHSFMGDDVICINHEQLTKTPKAEIERLLNYCGLEWSDKCLNFHKELKTVKTASFEQVRKPIQQKEKLEWENYKEHLADFISKIKPQYLAEYNL